jgi:hypothetical protein
LRQNLAHTPVQFHLIKKGRLIKRLQPSFLPAWNDLLAAGSVTNRFESGVARAAAAARLAPFELDQTVRRTCLLGCVALRRSAMMPRKLSDVLIEGLKPIFAGWTTRAYSGTAVTLAIGLVVLVTYFAWPPASNGPSAPDHVYLEVDAAIDAANAAVKRQDFAAAMQIIQPLADQGSAKAQDFLGFLYSEG